MVVAAGLAASIPFWFASRYVHGYLAVDLKQLGGFPFDSQAGTLSDIPARARELDGQHVKVEGQIFGLDSDGKRTRFQIVYDLHPSFGGPPLVQQRVFANAPKSVMGEHDEAYGDLLILRGIMHVKPLKDADGFTRSMFTMDVERIDREASASAQN